MRNKLAFFSDFRAKVALGAAVFGTRLGSMGASNHMAQLNKNGFLWHRKWFQNWKQFWATFDAERNSACMFWRPAPWAARRPAATGFWLVSVSNRYPSVLERRGAICCCSPFVALAGDVQHELGVPVDVARKIHSAAAMFGWAQRCPSHAAPEATVLSHASPKTLVRPIAISIWLHRPCRHPKAHLHALRPISKGSQQ